MEGECLLKCLGKCRVPMPAVFNRFSPNSGLNHEVAQGEKVEKNWPESQRPGAAPTSISAPWPCLLGGLVVKEIKESGCGPGCGGFLARNFERVLTGYHAPGQECYTHSHYAC